MMIILQAGGFTHGGVNFDAKIRRNSTDIEDLFIAHISGMDAFARAAIAAEKILTKSQIPALKKARYASFDSGDGKAYEEGKLSLADLHRIAHAQGEPAPKSGKQELYESILLQNI
jgi:xylose isomerase